MEENKIKQFEKKIRILFIIRIVMWIICAAGCVYWIYWSFKLYEIEEFEVHTYATHFRPYFNLGITISLVSITISLILRLISDSYKRAMKEEMYRIK
ncbi:MAG: hypothetical protein K6E47_10105 [Lachnospiraceae bacterium]|nr:hypothetical protein [Lachnospiraceae bacterium]